MRVSQRTASGLKALLVTAALVPILLLAHSGQFSRMIADDYCRIEAGLAHEPLQNVAYWRGKWTGSYSNYFLHAVFAPLDWQITRVMPAATSAIWLIGLLWLLWRAFGAWGWRRHRLVSALVCASLLLAAGLDALYSRQTFFHYTAHLAYAAPLALFTLYAAAVQELIIRLRRGRSQALAAVASLVFCFLNAGLSEMYLATQLALLLVFICAAFVVVEQGRRRVALLLLGAGLLGTVAGGVAQLAAPGVSMRAANSHDLVKPMRALPALIDMAARQALDYVIDAEVFAGFSLAFALGVAAAQFAGAAVGADSGLRHSGKKSFHLWIGSALQLGFVPFLWAHTSDAPQFFGRFSWSYMAVICLNLALIIGYIGMLLWRGRLAGRSDTDYTGSGTATWLTAAGAFALFMATQLLSVDYRVELFMYVSALVLLGNSSAQLPLDLPASIATRWRRGVIACLGAALATSLALSIVALYGVGFISARYMGPVAVLQIGAGFLWGALYGVGLGCHLRESGARSATVLAWRVLPLLVVLAMSVDIVAAQLRWLPDLQTFASDWDKRHQHIVEQRESGHTEITVWPLRYHMAGEFRNVSSPQSRIYENYCAAKYYGVEKIEVTDG